MRNHQVRACTKENKISGATAGRLVTAAVGGPRPRDRLRVLGELVPRGPDVALEASALTVEVLAVVSNRCSSCRTMARMLALPKKYTDDVCISLVTHNFIF